MTVKKVIIRTKVCVCVCVGGGLCQTLVCNLCLLFSSTSRWYWDILVVVLLIFTVIVLPVSIAFYSEEQTKPVWLTLNTIVDVLFITDIVINFRTGIASSDNPDIVS